MHFRPVSPFSPSSPALSENRKPDHVKEVFILMIFCASFIGESYPVKEIQKEEKQFIIPSYSFFAFITHYSHLL